MTRTKPPKAEKRTRTRTNGVVKKNGGPGSKPAKWHPSMIQRVYLLTLKGLIDADLAVAFGVDINSIHYWKRTKPEFMEALTLGKDQYDQRVERSLGERALGYSHPDTHISVHQGEVIITPITKHYPPDTAAAIFWLCNRQRERWNNNQRTEFRGALDIRMQTKIDLTGFNEQELNLLKEMGIKQLAPIHGTSG